MRKIFSISFLLTIVLSTFINAQPYSVNDMSVLSYKHDSTMKGLPKRTNFFGSFANSINFGGISPKAVVTNTCAYDIQMCPIDPNSPMARLTEFTTSNSMVGSALTTTLGGGTYWFFNDSLYPRLRNMPSELPGYVGASPVFLHVTSATDYDTYKNVRHCFYVSNKNNVKWRSTNGRVTIKNSTDNTTGAVRLESTGWDTLVAYYTVTGADTLKFPSKEITKIVPIYITDINNFCFAEEYTLTLLVQPTGTGYVDGAGTYLEGTKIPIEATPEHCYEFLHWINNKGDIISNLQEEVITLESDSTLIAVFERATYTVSAMPEPATAGTIMGMGVYPCDTTINLIATVNDTCYKFSYWQNLNTYEVSYEDTISVYIDNYLSFIAHFVISDTFNLELKSDPLGANVILTGEGDYPKCSENLQIQAKPNDNCTIFKYWTNENGDIITTQNPYNVNLFSDSVLIANFNASGFKAKLTPSPLDGGTVNGKTSLDTIVCDDKMVIEAVANADFWFYRWVDATTGNVISLFAKDTVEVNSNIDLIAEFLKEPVVRVILDSKPTGAGALTGDGSYTKGTEVTIRATPIADCSLFRYWEDNAGKIISNESEYTFTPETDTMLIAVFEIEEFVVTIYADSTFMGYITGGATGLHNCGTVLTLKAISYDSDFYSFDSWREGTVDGPILSVNPEISITIVSTTTVIAKFDHVGILEDDIYDITIVPNPTDNDFNIIFDNIDEQFISISLIDITGANILDIYDGVAAVGKQTYKVNTTFKLASGSYFVKFIINGKVAFRSLMIK